MSVNKESNETIDEVDGKKLKNMIYSSLELLKENQDYIDSLNVFPVPDGDTGTNMYLTYQEAVEKVKKLKSNRADDITSAMAQGALMGARGNSGVILSQLLRGLAQANEKREVISPDSLVKGLKNASEVAYQGVLKPVEGTILTVSCKAAEGAESALEEGLDIIGIMKNTVENASKALAKTPEQLPELKEAGVVDAGGQGYLTIMKGMLRELTDEKSYSVPSKDKKAELEVVEPRKENITDQKLKYTYCTQTLIFTRNKDNNPNIEMIRNELQNKGDSLMVVGSDNIIKIHIHTNHPGKILEYALGIGEIGDINIDNMEKQKVHKESPEVAQELNEDNFDNTEISKEDNIELDKNIGIISVAQGEGMKNIMKDLGVDIIIDGGQSMNPSTNDFVEAIEKLEVDKVIILPNNKNIISAAKQAEDLTDKEIAVIETRTIPEAITSLLVFNDQSELSDLKEAMESETRYVKTAEITTAVKDSQVKGLKINEGDIIGLMDGKIEIVGENYQKVVLELFEKNLTDEELITIYYGEEVDKKEATRLKESLQKKFELDEIEIYKGDQPLYPYIISLE